MGFLQGTTARHSGRSRYCWFPRSYRPKALPVIDNRKQQDQFFLLVCGSGVVRSGFFLPVGQPVHPGEIDVLRGDPPPPPKSTPVNRARFLWRSMNVRAGNQDHWGPPGGGVIASRRSRHVGRDPSKNKRIAPVTFDRCPRPTRAEGDVFASGFPTIHFSAVHFLLGAMNSAMPFLMAAAAIGW